MDVVINEDFCEADAEVVISTWLVDDGDEVEEGMVICEIMAEKAQMEFESPGSGKIKIVADIEQPYKLGDVIAVIG